jgi:hypothetical protein
MPKSIDVAECVGAQLRFEGHWPPNDLNKVMGADYHYTNDTLALFLVGVQQRLRNYQPPYRFTFDSKFAAACVSLSVGEMIGKIDGATTETALKTMIQAPKTRRSKPSRGERP